MRYWYDTEFIEDGRTIDLISIGMISEDGREYYAQARDCTFYRASDWVKQNVFPHLENFTPPWTYGPVFAEGEDSRPWRNRLEIAADLREFCDPERHGKPEFWGYYSAYDHVVLCQLFGAMISLPKGWPMYTRDIKQMCDYLGNPQLPKNEGTAHHALADAKWTKDAYEFLMEIKGTDRRPLHAQPTALNLRWLANRIESGEIRDFSLDRQVFLNEITQEGDKARMYSVSEHNVWLMTYTHHKK